MYVIIIIIIQRGWGFFPDSSVIVSTTVIYPVKGPTTLAADWLIDLVVQELWRHSIVANSWCV